MTLDTTKELNAQVPKHPMTQSEPLDPAPDPVEAARQRAADFVHNICTQAQLSLRERRDEIDNLTARMSNSERALVSYIGEFAKFSAEVLAMSTTIKSEIDHATLPFKADPPATITQLKNGDVK